MDHRAGAYYSLRQFPEAIADYDAAIAAGRHKVDLYTNRGVAHRALGQYAAAIADFDEAIRINPKDPAPHRGLAWLRATCPVAEFRDAAAALRSARTACALTGNADANCLSTLAAAEAEGANLPAAIPHQEQPPALAGGPLKVSCQQHLRRL